VGFVEIVGGSNPGGGTVEVRLRNGRELRVDASVDPEAVAKLASALEE
jgi:hypothetical protein